uniref:uncharacterized protein LOC120338970 n=1 Tax=Styela clava TaxID=7725 RepID=UPI0019394B80|nr:uncharacterized protein LOC120338970 [Styela clava]
MELSIVDVLEPGRAEEIQSKIQYATLVKCYQNLTKSKVDLISRSGKTYIELLLAACSRDISFFNWTKISPSELHAKLYDAIRQKIAVGLIAVSKIPLKKISSEVFRAGRYFISDNVVKEICCDSSNIFEVKQVGNEMVVQFAASPVKENQKSEPAGASKMTDRKAIQLKHLFKTNPEVIAALRHTASYKNILQVFSYWLKYCGQFRTEFLTWLLEISKLNSPNDADLYETNLNGIFLNIIKKFLTPSGRTISQLTDHLCIDKPGFITKEKVLQLIMDDPLQMFIADSTKYLPTGQRYVELTKEGRSSLLPADFDLPENLRSRIFPLLTTRVVLNALQSVYKIVIKTIQVQKLMTKYGCFCKYLIEMVKAVKPKLDTESYKVHLQSLMKPLIMNTLDKRSSQGKHINAVLQEASLSGVADCSFVREVVEYYSHEFVFVGTNKLAFRENCAIEFNEEGDAHEENYDPVPKEVDPLSDLESPRVLHLLTKQPRFIDIFDVFMTVPEASRAVLANNSMSFFEWLISLSKRLMPHDAPIFEAHLQNVIQKEVVQLHSRQHCQMTIHHVHSQLCMQYAMLLSPNFLSWCLEQSKSPFTVHQSWIYLKNSIDKRRSSHEPESSNTVFQQRDVRKRTPSPEALLNVVYSCKHLCDVMKAIKEIPLEDVGYIIQNNSYWFDYIENNIRDRKNRLKLTNLIIEQAIFCLEERILKIHDLTSLLSKGVPNFISTETLEYILQQRRDIFALAGNVVADCHVGVVRQVEGDDVICSNEYEENLMRQVLLYFPSSGSCDISTLLGIICKEDSYLYKDSSSPNPDYMKCFFMMFPMLFYARGDVIVLTCMALDKRGKYRSGFHPTSTTENDVNDKKSEKQNIKSHKSRKRRSRPRRHRHGKDSKRKRRSISSDRRSLSHSDEDIEINTTNDVGVNGNDHSDKMFMYTDNLVVDEDCEELTMQNLIDALPACLLVDIATSLLLNNNGKSRAKEFLNEVLRMTVASEECRQILSSTKMFSIFREKTFDALKNSMKFDLLRGQGEHVQEVKLKQDFESGSRTLINKGGDKEDDSQVEEITSTTSRTPERAADTVEPTLSKISEANVIIDSPQNLVSDDEIIKLSHTEQASIDSDISPVSRESDRKISDDRSSLNDTEIPKMPNYSVTASDNYVKPKVRSHKRKRYSSASREGQLLEFFKNYLEINAGSCSTDLLISSAHRRFHDERFARSRLAFEAYVYDLAFQNHDLFIFSGSTCEFGVTKISRSGGTPSSSPQVAEPANLFFLKFIPEVCKECCSFLCIKPNKRSLLIEVCEAVNSRLHDHLGIFSDKEITAVVHCLVLVALIRNLRLFCFSVNEPVVYLRDHKESHTKPTSPQYKYRREVENILQNPTLTDAILLMADIVRTCRPTSQTLLRNMWQTRAPPTLRKVFGTGISFTLSLRKYGFVFPSSDEGKISVDEDVMSHIVRPIE